MKKIFIFIFAAIFMIFIVPTYATDYFFKENFECYQSINDASCIAWNTSTTTNANWTSTAYIPPIYGSYSGRMNASETYMQVFPSIISSRKPDMTKNITYLATVRFDYFGDGQGLVPLTLEAARCSFVVNSTGGARMGNIAENGGFFSNSTGYFNFSLGKKYIIILQTNSSYYGSVSADNVCRGYVYDETGTVLLGNGSIYQNSASSGLSMIALYSGNFTLDNICFYNGTEFSSTILSECGYNYSTLFNFTNLKPETYNQSLTSNLNISFYANFTYASTNVTLYIDGQFNGSRNYTAANNVMNYTNQAYTDGTHNYTIGVMVNNIWINSTTRIFYIDTNKPQLLTNLTNNSIIKNNENNSYYFNFTDNIILSSVNISINGTTFYYNNSMGSPSFNISFELSLINFTGNRINLTARYADGHTATALKADYDIETPWFSDDEITFNFNKESGYNDGFIKLIAPDSADTLTATRLKDRYTFEYIPKIEAEEYTFEVESSFPIEIIDAPWTKYKKWIVFDDHWMDWDSEDIDNIEINRIDDYKVTVTTRKKSVDLKEIGETPKEIVFNSIGDLNIVTEVFYIDVFGYTLTNNNFATIGELNTFLLTITHPSSVSTNGYFHYNEEQKTTSKSVYSTYDVYQSSFLTPFITDSSVGYMWSFNLTNGIYNTTYYNVTGIQSIYQYYLYACNNATLANVSTFEVYVYDENKPTTVPLLNHMEIGLDYWTSNKSNAVSTNFTFDGSSNYSICIFPNTTLSSDIYVKFNVSGGYTHRWYLYNHTISNVSQNITVYNFDTTTGISELDLIVRDKSSYKYYPNALVKIQRNYVGEGIWRTVQMSQTGDYGLAIFNIIEKSTDYRLMYYDLNNNLLASTNSMKFSCTSGICSITYLLSSFTTTESTKDIDAVISYNNLTKMISIIWSTKDGSSTTINTTVLKNTAPLTTTICSIESTGSGGTQYCNASNYEGDVIITISSHNPTKNYVVYGGSINLGKIKLANYIGRNEGYFWIFIIILTCVMIGAFSPVGGLFAVLFGVGISMLLGLGNMLTYSALVIITILVIVLSYKVKA